MQWLVELDDYRLHFFKLEFRERAGCVNIQVLLELGAARDGREVSTALFEFETTFFKNNNNNDNNYDHLIKRKTRVDKRQGQLSEGEGSVQLASSLRYHVL